MDGFEDTSTLHQGVALGEEALVSIAISLKRIADAATTPTIINFDGPDAEAMVGWLKSIRHEGTVR